MSTIKPSIPPATHNSNIGRYAYLSKMVGMAVSYDKKNAKGVVMGCWTSNAGEPQFAVLGSTGEVTIVNVSEVRFYRAEAIVREAIETIDNNLAKSEERRESERKYRAKDRIKSGQAHEDLDAGGSPEDLS